MLERSYQPSLRLRLHLLPSITNVMFSPLHFPFFFFLSQLYDPSLLLHLSSMKSMSLSAAALSGISAQSDGRVKFSSLNWPRIFLNTRVESQCAYLASLKLQFQSVLLNCFLCVHMDTRGFLLVALSHTPPVIAPPAAAHMHDGCVAHAVMCEMGCG